MRWGNFKIRTKLTIMVSVLVIVTLAVSAGQAYWSGKKMSSVASDESLKLAYSDLDHLALMVQSAVILTNQQMTETINGNLNLASDRIKRAGGVSFAPETVTWPAVNQTTNQSTQVTLPKMLVGGVWLGQNRSPGVESPIVDEVKKITGSTMTIFQRMNDAGDMLRVCTNVETATGERAVGYYIAASDAENGAMVSTVLKGQRYVGFARVMNSWMFTAYDPLFDSSNRVVGMVFTGISNERMQLLRKTIMGIKVGQSGYVYVLDSAGNYVISKDGERDGENILNDQDSEGKYPIKEIIQVAKPLAVGQITEHDYFWKNQGDAKPRKKIVRITYYKDWDWIIGVGAYEDEFLAAETKIGSVQQRNLALMGGVFLILAMLALPFAWFVIAGSITSTLADSVVLAQAIAKGDLSQKVEIRGDDEIGQLGRALNHMNENLKNIILRIRASSASVASAADEISAASDQITKGAQSQASAADETSASMEQMSVNIQSVAKNAEGLATNVDETTSSIQQMGTTAESVAKNAESMAANVSETSATIEQMVVTIDKTAKNVNQADGISKQASSEAQAGGDAVLKTVDGMKRISEMMSNISGVIQSLGQRSEAIGNIVEVIEEIADQTNLLALNAAIEAARAGDAGRGFAVVADEVRKLAERSVKATKEIGEVIKQVQAETAAAVKVTEEGAKNSREGIELADKAGAAISRIMEAVNGNSHIMQEISRATSEQSSAAKNVIKAVEEMNRLTQSVTQATKEQAGGSRQVVKAAEAMAMMTEQVKNATAEQKKGGENVVKAVENISDIAKSNLTAVEQLSRSARDMAKQSEGLQELVQGFNVA